MIMQIVNLKSSLPVDQLLAIAKERVPQFRSIPGLLQKYYLNRPGEGEYAGVYIWDNHESMMAFRDSELAKSIPTAYQVTEPPVIEICEIMFPLREI